MSAEEKLGNFFVSCFYSVLDAEEKAIEAITKGKLSLKEVHVIEAVINAQKSNENNFSNVAKLLDITLGTLTISFNRLQKKGYLYKEQNQTDKRVYHIFPTREAEIINEQHAAFHKKMIDGIVQRMPGKDIDNLADALEALSGFLNELL